MRMQAARRVVSVVIGVARSILSGIANPARTLSARPSGLLRSAPPAVRFKTKPQAAGAPPTRQSPAAGPPPAAGRRRGFVEIGGLRPLAAWS